MNKRAFDDDFKRMAVDLSIQRGSVKEVADELGLNDSLLSKWRRRLSGSKEPAVSLNEDQKLIKRLQERVKGGAAGAGHIKKGGRHLFQERREIFGFIREHRKIFPVERMCKVLEVSCSGFYYWLKCPVSRRSMEQAELLVQIDAVHKKSRCRYGSPRITAELNKEGFVASRPRVARLMRRANIKSIVRKKYRVQTTDSNHVYPVVQNVLNRDFHAGDIGQKWVSYLTYIRTAQGWLYLTIVLDLADRKIVGWALSETMEASQTTIPAWQMAVKNRAVTGSLIFHSDRGVQYACNEFRRCLNDSHVAQSMSRKGNCWDNAVAESFFKTMKTEMVYHESFQTKNQAKLAVFEFIEVWYNRKRRHSSLGHLTPLEFEKTILNRKKVA